MNNSAKANTSNIQALESAAPLIVYIDIKSPYAFIAIEPTLALEAELGLQFDWRPLTLDIPSYLGSARKTNTGKVIENKRSSSQWGAVKYAYMDARRYADRQGHMLYGTQKIWDSSIANMGITWVVEQQRGNLANYLKQVYPPFWRRDLDIEDVAVVMDMIEKAGCNAEGFDDYQASDGRQAHDQLQAQLHPAGIFGVPTYVLTGAQLSQDHSPNIFFGRENLSYIRWCLQSQLSSSDGVKAYELGPAPDIENPF